MTSASQTKRAQAALKRRALMRTVEAKLRAKLREKRVRLVTQVTASLKSAVEAEARRQGISTSALVNLALSRHLEQS